MCDPAQHGGHHRVLMVTALTIRSLRIETKEIMSVHQLMGSDIQKDIGNETKKDQCLRSHAIYYVEWIQCVCSSVWVFLLWARLRHFMSEIIVWISNNIVLQGIYLSIY